MKAPPLFEMLNHISPYLTIMKKLISIVLLSFTVLLVVNAQKSHDSRNQLNAGIGLSGWGVPVYVGLDFGIHKDVSFGIEGSFRSYGQNYIGSKYYSTITGLSGNVNYHFNRILEIPRSWDLYAGLNLGYYFWSSSSNYPGSGSSELGLGAQIGVRYYINNRFGLNLEVGGGNAFSDGKFGISYLF